MNTNAKCPKATCDSDTLLCKRCGQPCDMQIVGLRMRTSRFMSVHITEEERQHQLAKRARRRAMGF